MAYRETAQATDSGLVSLEWLLIFAAIAGLAATSTLIVQEVLDSSSELPADVEVRVIDAEIASAELAGEANEAALAGAFVEADFERRCRTDLSNSFDDVLASASWTSPVTIPAVPDPLDPLAPPIEPARIGSFAQCGLRLWPGLNR